MIFWRLAEVVENLRGKEEIEDSRASKARRSCVKRTKMDVCGLKVISKTTLPRAPLLPPRLSAALTNRIGTNKRVTVGLTHSDRCDSGPK